MVCVDFITAIEAKQNPIINSYEVGHRLQKRKKIQNKHTASGFYTTLL